MKKLQNIETENLLGGDWDGACGFAVGFGMVAAFATSPIAPATWGFIGAGVISFCGGAALSRVYM